MKRWPVNSSRIMSAGWSGGVMELEFKGGAVYRYKVPESTYQSIISDTSPGKAFDRLVKPYHQGTRIQ